MAKNSSKPLAGLRVLLINDESMLARVFKAEIAEAGGIVTTAATAEEVFDAIKASGKNPFHVAICDFRIPVGGDCEKKYPKFFEIAFHEEMPGKNLILALRSGTDDVPGTPVEKLSLIALTAEMPEYYAEIAYRAEIVAGFKCSRDIADIIETLSDCAAYHVSGNKDALARYAPVRPEADRAQDPDPRLRVTEAAFPVGHDFYKGKARGD